MVGDYIVVLDNQKFSGLMENPDWTMKIRKNKDLRSKLHFYKMEYETLIINLERDLVFNVLDCVKPSGIPRMGKES